ncbi:hypothetical protein ACFY1J_31480 [Streptomyces sp. NPDC001406]|uniref:hypothetical protein n=1 Tax=Streptomyces sp. NPDC001406 TaxID=3364572 RepID=UPI00367AAC18
MDNAADRDYQAGAATNGTALPRPRRVPTGVVTALWAAGNAGGFAEQVDNAAGRGYRAGAAINGELLLADLDATLRV